MNEKNNKFLIAFAIIGILFVYNFLDDLFAKWFNLNVFSVFLIFGAIIMIVNFVVEKTEYHNRKHK